MLAHVVLGLLATPHHIKNEVTTLSQAPPGWTLEHLGDPTITAFAVESVAGRLMAVLGTLLQDNGLLQYYKKRMGCVSQKRRGDKAKSMSMQFVYSFSDTPLRTHLPVDWIISIFRHWDEEIAIRAVIRG
jgi:hypothetical protein